MRKIIFGLVLLMFAATARAEVLITAAQAYYGDPNVIVSFVNTEGQHVRAFALAIVIDGECLGGGPATITAVECLSDDYYVYPGSIQISGNEVTDEGSCVCDDSYDDTLPGIDSNGVTIEMASLYSPNDPDHNVAPADSGDLVQLTINGCGVVTISTSANGLRGKVVMQDTTSIDPNAPDGYAIFSEPPCIPPEDPRFPLWDSLGRPDCWCPEYECHGLGDTDGDCDVDTADVTDFIKGWNNYFIWPGPCADTDFDGDVDTGDIANLLSGWNSGCGSCTPIGP